MNFTVERLDQPALLLVRPRRFDDARGWFRESFREDIFAELGIATRFVQDNDALSVAVGTVRGLHFQRPPHAQAKLVRVLTGAVLDVAVDMRKGSPSYGRVSTARLSAKGGEQLFVPVGFAHGYCTLEPDTAVAYKCGAFYAPDFEGGIAALDPALAVKWPVPVDTMTMSATDRMLPSLREIVSPFDYPNAPA